jgi:dihydroorotase/N-acyl-D-amino-acid deacylase
MLSCKPALLLAVALLAGCAGDDTSSGEPFDFVLVGGTVYSGADEPPVIADVGITGDRIAAIGDLADRNAKRRLGISGLAVMPGIIDIHNHAIRPDESRSGIYLWPDAENLIRQGVTSVIGGPDGWSPLPIEDDFRRLEESPASVNYGTFVGHTSVREHVVGRDDRPATDEELQRMRDEVARAMELGAFGLSTGLAYAPASFAPTEEVIELARIASEYGGIYISHMRNEGLEVHASIRETIRIGEEAAIPVQITHHKVMGAAMWGRSEESLGIVDEAIARGVDVTSDQYPYTASSTGLSAVFPRWSLDGGYDALRERLEDPVERARIREEIIFSLVNARGGDDPSTVVLANCPWGPTLNGLDLAEVLRRKNRAVTIENAAEMIMQLQYEGGCIAVYHAMSIEDVERMLQHPKTMIASDGGVMAPGPLRPHPRNYGTFARVLGHYVRERELLSLQLAVHKMTRMVADRLGIGDRGRIEAGAVADVAVFDASTVIDRSTFEDPHRYAEGMRHVFVNGVPVLLDGEMTGARPGRILRSR